MTFQELCREKNLSQKDLDLIAEYATGLIKDKQVERREPLVSYKYIIIKANSLGISGKEYMTYVYGSQHVIDKYEALITDGVLIHKEDLKEKVDSLLRTVQSNMHYNTVKACAKHWALDLPHKPLLFWPPMVELDTKMVDGEEGIEKNFTK